MAASSTYQPETRSDSDHRQECEHAASAKPSDRVQSSEKDILQGIHLPSDWTEWKAYQKSGTSPNHAAEKYLPTFDIVHPNEDETYKECTRKVLGEQSSVALAHAQTDTTEKKGDAQSTQVIAKTTVEAEHKRLTDLAASHFKSDAERQTFINDMYGFERRGRSNNVSDEEIAKALGQVSRLLEANPAAVTEANRQLAARSLMHEMCRPMSDTNQGQHVTCEMTALAKTMLSRNPSKMAEIVATTAITGQWTNPADGKVITIAKSDLTPGVEEKTFPPRLDGDRTFATQLMNTVMINDYLQRKDPPQFYTQVSHWWGSYDEKVTYADGKPVGKGNFVGTTDEEAQEVATRLMGKNVPILSEFTPGTDTISGLSDELAELKKAGKLPVMVNVDAGDKIFQEVPDCLNWLLGKPKDSWHEICITNYDPKTGNVRLSNNWGQEFNIVCNINDLYRAMRLGP